MVTEPCEGCGADAEHICPACDTALCDNCAPDGCPCEGEDGSLFDEYGGEG